MTLEQFKTRWFRWLGQKTRCDKDTWVTLLDTNWVGWASGVLNRVGLNLGYLGPISTRREVYYYFQTAICEANMEELRDLDHRYVTDFIERPKPKRRST